MDPSKLTASLTELVKKFVISFCEVNVGYHDRLDVFGSIHVRSDDSDVVAFVLNEHCYKKPSEELSDDDDENESVSRFLINKRCLFFIKQKAFKSFLFYFASCNNN